MTIAIANLNAPCIILRCKIVFFLFFCFVSDIYASEKKDSIDFYLSQLDIQLKERGQYEQQKQKRIQKLQQKIATENNLQNLYQIYGSLFNEYQSYNYDSAFVYGNKMIDISEQLNDPLKLTDSRLIVAYSCTSAGLFLEAKDLLQAIDSTKLDLDRKVAFYSSYSKLYLDMALAIRHNPYEKFYYNQSIHYSMAIIRLKGNDAPISKLQLINIYRCEQKYDKAIEVTKEFLATEEVDERSKTLCIGGMGMFHLLNKDTLQAVALLTQAAIGDIKYVTKESSALSDLANIAYKRGNIERAYSYIKQSMNDAKFFNARHRKVEAGEIMPIIEASKFEMMQQQQKKLFISLLFVTFLFLCFITAMIFILKQMKQLKKARKLIQSQNIDLREVNKKLKEGNKIKDEYIGYFFSLNSAFMDEIESFRKLVSRKLASRQYSELMQIVKQADLKQNKENKFISFDGIFLKLFPDFVEHFNNLFPDKDKIILQSPHVLTTELRIFALIRLGVTDSEHIAKFLNYSVNTINTYKTKIKNRSIISNNMFELKIMEIESIKSDI